MVQAHTSATEVPGIKLVLPHFILSFLLAFSMVCDVIELHEKAVLGLLRFNDALRRYCTHLTQPTPNPVT